MVDKRKASDVLLSMEKRVKKLEKAVAQIDLNVKSILNKLNLATPKQPVAMPKAQPVGGPVVKPPETLFNQPEPKSELAFPQADEVPAYGNRKSVVEQRVVYADGRPVILAAVKIAESQIPTNIIGKVKTDSHGKWHTQLLGGKYLVEIIKGPTAAKRGFKIEYEIEVPGDGKPLALERKQVE